MAFEQLSPREFEQFRGFIYQQSGIKIGDRKLSLLSNRLRRRLNACGFVDFKSYFRFLTSPAATTELDFFLDAITTNETSFCRTATHFEWLRSTFIPDMVAAHQRRQRSASLRFWSAACASGAEAYSIAICAAENKFRLRDWSITILGTDISQQELAKARAGDYPPRALEAFTEQQRKRFFRSKDDAAWQIKPEIKAAVEFAQHNLMLPLPRPPFDCVFLCNVLIYFDQKSKLTVIENVQRALKKGGYLVIGPSEGVFDVLGSMQRHAACVYQKVH